jgi:hypothetical protein
MTIITKIAINLSFLFILLIIMKTNVIAEEKDAFFFDPGLEESPTNIAYVGQQTMDLRLIFEEDCKAYSVETSSPLFIRGLRGIPIGINVSKGSMIDHDIELNPDAVPGIYPLTVHFNYTNIDGEIISTNYSYQIHYLKSFKIVDVKYPSGKNHEIMIEIQIFSQLSKLLVIFDADGSIEVEQEEFNYNNLPQGNQSISTIIKKSDSLGSEQEVGYHVIGYYSNNRIIEYSESNIRVDVEWDPTENGDDASPSDNARIKLIILLLCILSILALTNFIMFRFVRSKKT